MPQNRIINEDTYISLGFCDSCLPFWFLRCSLTDTSEAVGFLHTVFTSEIICCILSLYLLLQEGLMVCVAYRYFHRKKVQGSEKAVRGEEKKALRLSAVWKGSRVWTPPSREGCLLALVLCHQLLESYPGCSGQEAGLFLIPLPQVEFSVDGRTLPNYWLLSWPF